MEQMKCDRKNHPHCRIMPLKCQRPKVGIFGTYMSLSRGYHIDIEEELRITLITVCSF